MKNVEAEYWLERWQSGQTGWHQSEVEPALATWMKGKPPLRILVPLCGKSLDLIWLASQGHQVTGIELSPIACQALFEENHIPFTESVEGGVHLYKGPNLKIFNGDFFKLTAEHLGAFDAVYDRAALIAMPPEMRNSYSEHLTYLTARAQIKEFLQVVLERNPPDAGGPPFSVSVSEVENLYSKDYKIELLSREAVEAKGPSGSRTNECVLLLTPLKSGF